MVVRQLREWRPGALQVKQVRALCKYSVYKTTCDQNSHQCFPKSKALASSGVGMHPASLRVAPHTRTPYILYKVMLSVFGLGKSGSNLSHCYKSHLYPGLLDSLIQDVDISPLRNPTPSQLESALHRLCFPSRIKNVLAFNCLKQQYLKCGMSLGLTSLPFPQQRRRDTVLPSEENKKELKQVHLSGFSTTEFLFKGLERKHG